MSDQMPEATRFALLRDLIKVLPDGQLDLAHDVVALLGLRWVLLRPKSHRALLERVHRAEARSAAETDRRESAERWARDSLTRERYMADRATYLYGAAIAAGATPESLRGDT